MLRIKVWTTTALVGAALAGCGGGGGEADEGGADMAQFEGPIASNDVARGEQVVDDVCMACHSGGAPALENLAWDPARMRHQIRMGSGRMPAITASRVSDDDLEAALAYMATIGAVTSEGGGAPTTGGAAEPMEEGAEPMGEGDEATETEDADEDVDEAVDEGA